MQISLFDGTQQFKIDKPIRLIELFAGYGSQALALKYLGVPFEHYRLSEWAVKSIQAYKDMHFADDNTDYSKDMTVAEVKAWLYGKISADYNTPMTEQQINRLPEKQVRTIYNNMQATYNLGSITQITANDLNIVDTNKYCYIMTYSFPCQDLSSAGKGAGMGKGSGTRSSSLWEVERLLDECEELPQVLLMENVPQVIGQNNIQHFAKWIEKLEQLGYKNKWQVLNAKDYGIPQNRNRCFMVSVLGDYYYDMPTGFKLEYVLKDFLDKNVDESYYLKDKTIRSLNLHKERHEAQGHGFGWKPSNGGVSLTQLKPKADIDQTVTLLLRNQAMNEVKEEQVMIRPSRGYFQGGIQTLPQLSPTIDAHIACWHVLIGEKMEEIKCNQVGQITAQGYTEMTGRVYGQEGLSLTINTCCGGHHEPKILEEPIAYDEQNGYLWKDGCVGTLTTDNSSPKHNNWIVETNYRIRKLTEQECFRLMGVEQQDFEKIRKNQSKSSLYHLAGDSIVVNVLMAIFKEML